MSPANMRHCLLLALLAAAPAEAQVSVVFSPPAPQQGEPITVTLINHSATFGVALPSSCLYHGVHPLDCSQPAVLTPFCNDVFTIIGPGDSKSSVWDQKDDQGSFVPPGVYAFNIGGFLCASVTISGPCSIPPTKIGVPSSGTSFYQPRLEATGGMPVTGNAAFGAQITFALGGAPALLLLGVQSAAQPTSFGTVYVALGAPHLMLPFTLGGAPGVAGAGNAQIALPVPPVPSLQGLSFTMQTLVSDPGAKGGVAHTEGLQLTVCPN